MSEINAEISEVIQVLRFSGEALKDFALLIKGAGELTGKALSKSALKALQITITWSRCMWVRRITGGFG